MKRSRRVLLKMMGSVAIGAMSMGLTQADARSHRRHAAAQPKDQVSPRPVTGGFGGAPRQIARFGDDDPSHGGS